MKTNEHLADAEHSRAPLVFEDWIEHPIGENQVRMMSVQTDGADYHLAAGWGEWSEAERDDADEWTRRLHLARVEIAELVPADGEWISSHVEGAENSDPDVLESALASLALKKGGA